MRLEYEPLLRIQREIQGMPFGRERFRAYLRKIWNCYETDFELIPLLVANPMGKGPRDEIARRAPRVGRRWRRRRCCSRGLGHACGGSGRIQGCRRRRRRPEGRLDQSVRLGSQSSIRQIAIPGTRSSASIRGDSTAKLVEVPMDHRGPVEQRSPDCAGRAGSHPHGCLPRRVRASAWPRPNAARHACAGRPGHGDGRVRLPCSRRRRSCLYARGIDALSWCQRYEDLRRMPLRRCGRADAGFHATRAQPLGGTGIGASRRESRWHNSCDVTGEWNTASACDNAFTR